jgi:hypothetical protein
VDLSKFGIYNSFDAKNYEQNCLLTAIESSNKVPKEDIELLKSTMNCRVFPAIEFDRISKLIQVNFTLEKYYEEKHDYGKIKNYIIDPDFPTIHLLLRNSHYFIDDSVPATYYYIKNKALIDAEPKINPLRKTMIKKYNKDRHSWDYEKEPKSIKKFINYLFKNDLFEPITDLNYSIAIKAFKPTPLIMPLEISNKAYREKQLNHNNSQLCLSDKTSVEDWLSFKTYEWYNVFQHFSTLMKREFHLNPENYSSLAEFGQALMHETGCYENVYEVRGNVAKFIRLCCPNPIVATAYDKPQKIVGDIVQIDKNSSYPSVYRDFEGIPTGEPRLITQFATISSLKSYFIAINITKAVCKLKSDPFPLIIDTGVMFMNKRMFEFVKTCYEIEYKFITGVSFEGFNTKIQDLSNKLYEMRLNAKKYNHPAEKVIKRLLNSLWGKSIQKEKPTYEKYNIADDKLDNFLFINQDFIYSDKKTGENSNKVILVKTIMSNYSTPHFASNVLNYSKIEMLKLVHRSVQLDLNVVYINTDCLTMLRSDFDKLDEDLSRKGFDSEFRLSLISDKMGDFSIEVESKLFIALSPYKNIHVLNDNCNRLRCRSKIYGNPVQYFMNRYENLTE